MKLTGNRTPKLVAAYFKFCERMDQVPGLKRIGEPMHLRGEREGAPAVELGDEADEALCGLPRLRQRGHEDDRHR